MAGLIKILIADDHKIFLQGITSLLQTEPTFEIIATANNGYEAVHLAKQMPVDVCLLDISMPMLDGIEAAAQIIKIKPSVKIIILTTYSDKEIISRLIQTGISGYLLKNTDKAELIEAINKVMAGRHYFSTVIEDLILAGLTDVKKENPVLLTDREIEIIRLLSQERTNEDIADILHISYRTVETHRKNIMHKTNSHNLAGLLKYAYSNKLV